MTRLRRWSPADVSRATIASLGKGTGLVALLTGAVMFALGLFFGWLLHRERVERTLYEHVVRSRDRANATLAETSARLELANRDVVRLRGQLMEAQHLLDAREAAIVRLEREVVAHVDATAGEPGVDGGRRPRSVGRSPRRPASRAFDEVAVVANPSEGRLFDQLDLDEEIDTTEEVAGASAVGVGGAREVDDRAEEDDVVAVVEDPADGDLASDDVVTDDVVAEPSADAAAPVVVEVAASAVDAPADELAAPHGDVEVVADTEGDTEVVDAPVAAPAEVPVDADAPVVADGSTDVDAPAPDVDDLRRINGVGPALERQLRDQGITTFRQLALLDDAAIDELQSREPRLVTRLRRGNWVSQARRLHVDTYGDEP